MNEILAKYTRAEDEQDLFLFWETELLLRRQLRQASFELGSISPASSAELDFLCRSLYFAGRKKDFFQILFNNMHIMPVLNWLMNSPQTLICDFLEFMPWYIDKHPVEPQKLQFIINIYKVEFQQLFAAVINVISLESCSFLLSRSANPGLRELIKHREERLLKERDKLFYGISTGTGTYPTFFGDKSELLREAINLLQASSAINFREPYGAARFHLLLQASDKIFQCGMVEDCLVIALDIYEDYQQKNRLVELLEDEKIYKEFYRLLRKTIPVYGLLLNPLQAYSLAIDIYDRYFPRIDSDPASLQYLNIYESILEGLTGKGQHILMEIFYKVLKIQEYRPREQVLLYEKELLEGLDNARLLQIEKLYQEKMTSLPHEAFVSMEFSRFLQKQGKIVAGRQYIKHLLSAYVQLWKWLPSRLFIKQDIIEELGPLADEKSRKEATQLLEFINDYSDEKLKNELQLKPDLFKKKKAQIKREIFTGKFLGVL